MSNTTGATCGAGSAYPSGAMRSPLVFDGVRGAYSLVLHVVSCVLLFVCLYFSFLAMSLSVFRFMSFTIPLVSVSFVPLLHVLLFIQICFILPKL